MRSTYNPSVNIIRDAEVEFNYIPTPNSKRAVAQIIDDFRKGLRSFQVIGSYGTGKSSFLWALEQSLTGRKPYFNVTSLNKGKVDVIKLVGNFNSLINAFEELFGIARDGGVDELLTEVYSRYHSLGKNGLLLLEIDEFGKFLEYAAKNNPEKELYFIQQLAEFANNPKHNIILIATIHQSFESYGFGLNNTERQEWSKVKGRFKEITFNEPVEQLLYLAAEHIQDAFDFEGSKRALKTSLELFDRSKAFSFDEGFSKEVNNKIYPVDLVAANVLTLALQRYGQNERSLFSFLESTDFTSIAKFVSSSAPFYNLAAVYDYLNFNFYSFLASKYNPDFAAWNSIRYAIESIERQLDREVNDGIKLVKAMGLLNIFAAAGAVLDKAFWSDYGKTIIGIKGPENILELLTAKSVIRYRNYSKRYILFEGTDLDIETALIEAGNKVSDVTDVPTLLRKYFDFPPVLAKAYSYANGTPRYFEYLISDQPDTTSPAGEIDGFVNLIFSDKTTIEKVKQVSAENEQAVVYGLYVNYKEIKTLLYDIEKTQKVFEENLDDRIALRELENILAHQKSLLTHYIVNNLFGKKSDVVWIYKGKKLNHIRSKRAFNQQLSLICKEVFSGAPVFKNELVNKNKISSAVFTAKKNFFRALANQYDQPDLGFDPNRFPPEKMIYVTLLKKNQLTGPNPMFNLWSIDPTSSFKKLWDHSNEFIDQARKEKISLAEFVSSLQQVPYKLKQGLIDFWVPTFLFLKKDDFALFGPRGFIPNLTDEVLDLISKDPKSYAIKSFDIAGVKLDIFNNYRLFLNQDTKDTLTNRNFIETIKPFLVFYRSLPEYSRNTKRLSREAIAIREAIVNSQDPEKTFFEDFPMALGSSIDQLKNDNAALNGYTQVLQAAIRELRTSFEALVDRFEEFIQNEIIYEQVDFEAYKKSLQSRFVKLKKHLLLPAQRTLVQRIDSELDDKRAWLSSICQAITGRTLETLKDDDELLLFDKLKDMVIELDSLTNLSQVDIDDNTEEVIGLQIDSFGEGKRQKVIRLPKNMASKVDELKTSLKGSLSNDKSFNIAALTKLLQELTNE